MGSRLIATIRRQWAGYLALFLTLTGGTAVALSGSNTVFSDDIVNGQVKSVDVANDGLTEQDLANISTLRSSGRVNINLPNNGVDDTRRKTLIRSGPYSLVATCEEQDASNENTIKASILFRSRNEFAALSLDDSNLFTTNAQMVAVGPFTVASAHDSTHYVAVGPGEQNAIAGDVMAATFLNDDIGADCSFFATAMG